MAKLSSKKGLEMRNLILEASKKLFHDNGYKNTSIAGICSEAKTTLGNFTYHFKTKADVVSALYEDLFVKSHAFVNSNIKTEMNSFEKNIHVAFIYFYGILCDDNTKRFHYEIIQRESVGDYINGVVNRVFAQFANDFNLRLTEKELNDIIDADNGISRELMKKYLDKCSGSEKKDINNIISTLHLFRGRLMTINETLTREYIKEGELFEAEHDHSHIKLLG